MIALRGERGFFYEKISREKLDEMGRSGSGRTEGRDNKSTKKGKEKKNRGASRHMVILFSF